MRMNAKTLAALSCGALMMAAPALAAPVQTGQTVTLSGTTASESPWLPGVSVSGTDEHPFLIRDSQQNPLFQGTLTASVVRSTEMGTLNFQYRIVTTQAMPGRSIVRVEVGGYQGFQTNVDYREDGSGVLGPGGAARSVPSGSFVAFYFQSGGALEGGVDSRFFHVFTDAGQFARAGTARIVLNTGESIILDAVLEPALTDCPGDTNGDGVVNFTDLNTVLSDFGDDCN